MTVILTFMLWNTFCINGYFWGESTDHWWILLTKDQLYGNFMFSLLSARINCLTSNQAVSDWRWFSLVTPPYCQKLIQKYRKISWWFATCIIIIFLFFLQVSTVPGTEACWLWGWDFLPFYFKSAMKLHHPFWKWHKHHKSPLVSTLKSVS